MPMGITGLRAAAKRCPARGGRGRSPRAPRAPRDSLGPALALACCLLPQAQGRAQGGAQGGADGGGYTIAAQPLGPALLDLARQSGRDVLFRPEQVRGCLAAPVVGERDFEVALVRLIARCHLRHHLGAGGAIELERAAPDPLRADVPQEPPLPEVMVLGRPYEAAPIALPSPHAVGLVEGLSAAQIAQVPDQTVAETLGRLAGVNVMLTSLEGDLGGIDRAGRAEGQFAAVRGLGSAYTTTVLDGVPVAQSLPYSRGVQLSLIPSLALGAVSLTRTPAASDAGDATGGQFDLRLATAGQGHDHLRLSAQGEADERSLSLGRPGLGGLVALDASHRWGRDGALGVAVTGYYGRSRFASTEQTYQSGQFEYRLTGADGRPPAGMNPAADLLATSLNVQYAEGEVRRWGGSLAADWTPGERWSAYAHLTLATSDTNQSVYQMGFQGGRDPSFITRVPVGDGLYLTQSVKTQVHYWFETNPDTATLGTAQVGGQWRGGDGAVTLSPRLFYAWGENSRPQHIEMSFWSPASTTVAQGLSLGTRGGLPVMLGPAAAAAMAADPDGLTVSNRGEITSLSSRDDRYGGGLDATARLSGDATLEMGAQVSLSHRASLRRDQEGQSAGGLGAVDAGATLGALADVGLRAGTLRARLSGVYDYAFPLIDADRLARLYAQRDATATWTADAWNGNTLDGTERVLAGYAQVRWRVGDVDLLPGLRTEVTDITNRYWLSGNNGVPSAGIAYGWNETDSHYLALLPRFLAHWQAPDGGSYRAAVWTSQNRPSPFQLAGNATTSVDADGVLTLTRGNPDLKPVDGVNVDLSGAWDWTLGPGEGGAVAPFAGHLSVAVFHKRLFHYLYDAGPALAVGAGTTSTDELTRVSIPTNGGTARLTGVEISADQALGGLAAIFAPFTLGGTVSWETTAVRLNDPDLDPVEQVQNAPRWLAGLRLLYAQGGAHASLGYHWTDAYIQSYGTASVSGGGTVMAGSALDTWVRPSQRLDLRLGYDFASGLAVDVSVRNLAGALTYRTSVGRVSDAVVQTVDAGRTIKLTVRQDF